ncbi:hypothetical protein H0R94_08710 [Treponema socranskii]|uniref:hypothetical protein n=2 Tax=Treponema TaxID=157 RepID=UPI003D8CE903
MKRKICFLLILLFSLKICFANENSKFDLITFYKNPFIKKEMYPEIFYTYLDFENYFKNETFEISSEVIQNKYDKTKNNIRYKLNKDNITLYYLHSGYNGKCFLELMSIIPNKELLVKYGFYKGMDEKSVLEICGKKFYQQNHKINYELCFYGNGPWQINFSFNSKTKKLSKINFWYGVD